MKPVFGLCLTGGKEGTGWIGRQVQFQAAPLYPVTDPVLSPEDRYACLPCPSAALGFALRGIDRRERGDYDDPVFPVQIGEC